MKRWIVLLLWVLACFPVLGQDDDTLQYIYGLPETGEDTSQQIPQHDLAPADTMVQIGVEQVPRELLRTLSKEPQFAGWQNDVLQLNKNTGLYWLHMRRGNVMRSYGFNRHGKPVSMNEKTIQEDR
jgi:hypothetical protein